MEQSRNSKRQRRQATLYDAVAGRVSSQGFLQGDKAASTGDTSKQTSTSVPPQEALYRQRNAPLRYQEDDVYFQHRHLKPGEQLPDSDLLKAVHAYAADFYASTGTDSGKLDEKSLDETALLAIGILLEEAAAKTLGKSGHLALLEEP